MRNHLDDADAGKEQDIAYAQWLHERQREPRAAQQRRLYCSVECEQTWTAKGFGCCPHGENAAEMHKQYDYGDNLSGGNAIT